MNSWNYRVIKKLDPSNHELIYQVHEVYYGKSGVVECWNDSPVEPMGVNTAGLRNDIQAFLSAFRLPSLEEKLQNGKPKLIEELKQNVPLHLKAWGIVATNKFSNNRTFLNA